MMEKGRCFHADIDCIITCTEITLLIKRSIQDNFFILDVYWKADFCMLKIFVLICSDFTDYYSYEDKILTLWILYFTV